jgi:hypothetical protein
MLEHSLIIALLVLSVWYTLQEGEIFGKLGEFFSKHTPSFMHQPLYECNVCMTVWYGSALYWLFPWQQLGFGEARLIEWPIVVIVAMGINAALNKLSPDK